MQIPPFRLPSSTSSTTDQDEAVLAALQQLRQALLEELIASIEASSLGSFTRDFTMKNGNLWEFPMEKWGCPMEKDET